jgi:hypothetical protein
MGKQARKIAKKKDREAKVKEKKTLCIGYFKSRASSIKFIKQFNQKNRTQMIHSKKILESKRQAKIIAKLKTEGWYVIKLIKTSVSGIPDLLCLKNGETMFIEVKQPDGKLSELQNVRIGQLLALGFDVKVWTDYKEDFVY